jgi:hypothetical protein
MSNYPKNTQPQRPAPSEERIRYHAVHTLDDTPAGLTQDGTAHGRPTTSTTWFSGDLHKQSNTTYRVYYTPSTGLVTIEYWATAQEQLLATIDIPRERCRRLQPVQPARKPA